MAQGKLGITHRPGRGDRMLQGSKAAEPVRGASAAGSAVQEPCPGSHGQVSDQRDSYYQSGGAWIILSMWYFHSVSVVQDVHVERFIHSWPLL